MATKWTGSSGDWKIPGNWSGGVVPSASIDTLLDNSVTPADYMVTVDSPDATGSLTIQPGTTGGVIQLTVESGGLLNLGSAGTAGTLTFGGGSSIDHDSIILVDGGGTIMATGAIQGKDFAWLLVYSGGLVQTNASFAFTGTHQEVVVLGTLNAGAGTTSTAGFVNFAPTGASSSVLDVFSGGVIDSGTSVIVNGANSTGSTLVRLEGTIMLDDNSASTDTGSNTSLFQNAAITLDNGTIDLGTSYGDGRSGLTLRADTLKISGISTINGINVKSTGASTVGVNDTGTTTVSAGSTLNITTQYAINNNGTSGKFTNDGTVNVTGANAEIVLLQHGTDVLAGSGVFNVNTGATFVDTGDAGLSAVSNANIVLNSGTFEVSFAGNKTIDPGSLTVTIPSSIVIVGKQSSIAGTATYNAVNHTITYTDGHSGNGHQMIIQNVTLGNAPSEPLTVTSNGNATDTITLVNGSTSAAPCFAAGTRIRVPTGEAAVERLCVGDRVIVVDAAGETERAVVWIGSRLVNVMAHRQPELVAPVRIKADAFAAGLPQRDLLLSPEHCVYFDDMLVPIQFLINGDSIRQEMQHQISYFHIELAQHAVLLAEGLPCESFLDTGNKNHFEHDDNAWHLWSNFGPGQVAAEPCARIVRQGAGLEIVYQRLLDRAAEMRRNRVELAA